jgi:hypothetical protein
MPLYLWTDTNTGYRTEVYRRSAEDYKVPPAESELPADEQGKERTWVKLISPGIKAATSDAWQASPGGKGRP